jgi:hypothetical protein
VEVLSPDDKTYEDGEIALNISASREVDEIEYRIDGGVWIEACDDCDSFEDELGLDEGEHNLTAKATFGDKIDTDFVEFDIRFPENDFDFDIIKPEPKDYGNDLSILVRSNVTLDRIEVRIGSAYDEDCDDCAKFEDVFELENGTYTLVAKGTLDDVTKQKTVVFTVNKDDDTDDDDDDGTYDDGYGKPRFDLGFNKLPQAVEAGEITDEELAEILRDNKINPGILNRLIKTGKLGEESIEAILENQFRPQGLFGKLLSWIGIEQSTYATEIYKHYNLSEKLEQKIVTRDDLPKKYVEKVKANLQKKVHGKKAAQVDAQGDGESNSLAIGKQIPPGQAKKMDITDDNPGRGNIGKTDANVGNGNGNSGKSKNSNGNNGKGKN